MQTPDDNKTIEFNYGKSVFPLLSCERDEKGLLQDPKFLGTGFFAVIEGFPIIISAKHVLGGSYDRKEELFIATRYGAKSVLLLLGGVVEHATLDIAFYVLEPEYYKKHQDEFRPIPIVYESLSVGMDVSTFGFPNSLVVRESGNESPVIEIDQYFFKGYICNIIDSTGIGGTKKSYLVNFPAMSGISGAPLLTLLRGEVVCVGYMFQERSISQKVDEKQIELNGQEVSIPVYQTYTFGVACDAHPLIEVQKLLAGAPKGPKL